jgi:hypothetical protein
LGLPTIAALAVAAILGNVVASSSSSPIRELGAASLSEQPPPQGAKYLGLAATRDEYLAYLAYLARQHIDLLPRSLVGSRHGQTIINVVVRNDGTIAMLSVGSSSGYPTSTRESNR